MGKLRVEPKIQQMSSTRYREILEVLHQAQRLSGDAHLYYDLDDNEDASDVKKDFHHVAEKEGLTIKMRRPRGDSSYQIFFESGPVSKSRISSGQTRERILSTLAGAKAPMRKGDILDATGINTSSWNLRITELLREGKVIRQGSRREAVYTLG